MAGRDGGRPRDSCWTSRVSFVRHRGRCRLRFSRLWRYHLEQSLLLGGGVRVGRIEPEVTIRLGGGDATARSALEEPILDEERLVDFLEGARVLADGGGDGADADRS